MTTPVIRTALERLVELDKRIEDVIPGIEIDNWIDAMDAARAALKPKPEGQRPTDGDLYDLAEQFNGDPVAAMRHALELWGNPLQGAPEPGESPAAAPAPVPETPAEALAARPLLERVAQLGDVIGRQTVAQVQQLANQAAVWLRENPPGQPVAIDPRDCPTPGAYSCVEPTSQAPEPGEAKELHPLWYLVEFLEGHSAFRRRTDPTDELAQVLSDSATLLKRLESPACLVVGGPHQGAPAPGENLATALGEADMDHVEQLAAIIRRVDGNNSMGAAALAEAILGRYPCAFLVDPLDTPPAPERAVPHCRRAGPVNSALPTTITFDPQC